MEADNKEPVLVVKNKGGFLIHVGEPSSFKKKLLGRYAQKGYTIITMTIEKYRKNIANWEWFWEKRGYVPEKKVNGKRNKSRS